MPNDASAFPELGQALAKSGIEVRTDLVSRLLYSTDASIYQIEPYGVAFPRHCDEINAIVEFAAQYQVPLVPRGAGSSLAGQAIGSGLVIDCSRYLDRIVEVDPQARIATFEPGLVLNELNRAASQFNLIFGPDPASAERATLGGALSTNATGAHSIRYGMCADHLLSVDVVLSDGSQVTWGEIALEEAEHRAQGRGLEAAVYRAALSIRQEKSQAIQSHWPQTWRRASGYNLNYLLPWSPGIPPAWSQVDGRPYPPVREGHINLAQLVAGSEGTLALIRRATVGIVPIPAQTRLGVIGYDSIAAACADVPAILEYSPAAVELIPYSLIKLARAVPAYASRLSWIEGLPGGAYPEAILVVEFAGDDGRHLENQVRDLKRKVLLAATPAEQKQVWDVRKLGLGIVSSRPGERRAPSFMEDLTVPIERLGELISGLDEILAANGSEADYFGHASAGCMHIHPLINLTTSQGMHALREIAYQAAHLTIRLGGTVSGEHGDGIARAGWLPDQFGAEIMAAFRQLKRAADPHNLLNPGKILDAPELDAQQRYGAGYQAKAWPPRMDFTRQGGAPGEAGLIGAVDMCNGAGVCRKTDGVMCPSFQATREELHSTRGRANLLRALMSGRFPTHDLAEKAVYQALDLCLACKGCKAECPSAVDMAKLKYEFLQQFYTKHPRRWRDYLFAYLDRLAAIGQPFGPIINPVLRWAFTRRIASITLGLAEERVFPAFARQNFHQLIKSQIAHQSQGPPVWLLADTFSEYFYPQAGMAAVKVLQAAGFQVQVLPVLGAGRTLISKGFLEAAQAHARGMLAVLKAADPQGEIPVVGIEPSEIYTLRDEYPELLPDDAYAAQLAQRAWMVDEYLIRPRADGSLPLQGIKLQPNPAGQHIFLHGHCYQKAQAPAVDGFPVGVTATTRFLETLGYKVSLIEAGCCGMAGAFGYEKEHYAISQAVGEDRLFPAVRAVGAGGLIAAAGISCQAQIGEGTGREVHHPLVYAAEVLMPAA